SRGLGDVYKRQLITSITLYFFLIAHPTVIISGDDWGNLIVKRGLYPQWGIANPIKVMPEVSYPLLARISILIIMPFGFDFLRAFSILTAIFITILISAFFFQLYLLLKNTINIDNVRSAVISFLVYMLVFSLFRESGNHESLYMLWEVNITCFYHYIAPALINSTLVLYIIRNEKSLSINSLKERGFLFTTILFLITYLCIFSSMFANIILAVACGVFLLISLYKNKFHLSKTVREMPLQILSLIMWMIAVIFEANGGRAKGLGGGKLDIKGSINVFIETIDKIQPLYLYAFAALLIMGFVISIRSLRDNNNKNSALLYLISLSSALLTLLAVILLSSKAGSYYAARPVVLWGIFLYSVIAATVSFKMIFKSHKISTIALLFAVIPVAYSNTMHESTLKQSINLNLDYNTASLISQSIIDQVVKAEKENKKEVVVIVPKGDNNDNWPFPVYEGAFISGALKMHKIIQNDIPIKIQPDPSINERLSIPLQ
ncbi:hypothetical protein, partial [Kosakonia sp. BK9b]